MRQADRHYHETRIRVVALELKYLRPARFGEELRVRSGRCEVSSPLPLWEGQGEGDHGIQG